MTDRVFVARGVGKQYQATSSSSLVMSLVQRRKPPMRWVLRDVDLDVGPGEVVAVIGRNGAGKSTLLKVAAGVTTPTTGSVERARRIAPLIEVGAGFHPELTGRENVHVNARLLGVGRREIERRFDDIVDFAELGHVIDEPVRQYSSGMFMRLGFSVAIHTDPELLIVDEVLAVGDLPFQARCLERVESMRAAGVGSLFVSHDISAVLRLADRAVLLDGGEVKASGEPREVVGAYHALLASGTTAEGVPTSGELRIDEVSITDDGGEVPLIWSPGQRATLHLDVTALQDTTEGIVGFRIHRDGTGMVGHWRADDGPFVPALRTGERARISLGLALNVPEGAHRLEVAVARRDWSAVMCMTHDAPGIAVANRPGGGGIVDLDPQLVLERR